MDENGNGEVEFDEFVMMVSWVQVTLHSGSHVVGWCPQISRLLRAPFQVSNMRSGKSSFRLAMLLSLLPDGNEVSENARNRVAAYGNAIKSANIRCVRSSRNNSVR